MPIVTVLAIEGRTAEQKRGLVKDITEAVVKNFYTSPEKVSMAIRCLIPISKNSNRNLTSRHAFIFNKPY